MANKVWIGGQAGNDAGFGGNWSPAAAPRSGDNLTVVTGTLEIGPRDLAGDTLHLNDALVDGGGLTSAPVTLDLSSAKVGIDGLLFFGDPLTINATGQDHLNAAGGFETITGSINLADHAHLFMTGGSMKFDYGGSITGGAGSVLTNNGSIEMTNGNVSVPVNGTGTLAFDAYHSARGNAHISAPVTASQTVELKPLLEGLTMTLDDPGDFHALLKLDPSQNPGANGLPSIVVSGVHANGVSVHGNNVMLTDGGKVVDMLKVADAGSLQITATDGAAGTTLQFLMPH